MHSGTNDDSGGFTIAVIDGPYDTLALSSVLASAPVSLAGGSCAVRPNEACDHGTFILGLLGARTDSAIPGLCPNCRLLHVPLFADAKSPSANLDDLATAIARTVAAGARLINLSLAIIGTAPETNRRLAAALDFAEQSGAVLLVAAGNQGRLATGQLLTHPAVIPVVAAGASQRLLPASNFGPAIASRGIAALGRMPGYAPGGGIIIMSGTSIAAAVATGILAELWSTRPELDGATLRAAIASLGPRNGSTTPALNRESLISALDRMIPTARAIETTACLSLQGATMTSNGYGQAAPVRTTAPNATSSQAVAPAGCGCGAPGGLCTCHQSESEASGFVYAIGTIEAEYPNVAIEREMQTLARHLGVEIEPDSELRMRVTEDRHWQHAVLSKDRRLTRYIARQLRWQLSIEDFPVFVLHPSDPGYFDDLIDALARPKYAKQERRGAKRASAAKASPTETQLGPIEDLDVIIGVAGLHTSDGTAVLVDQIFQVDHNQLAPGGVSCFSQLVDNSGLSDEDRAYNFLGARYTPPFSEVEGFALTGMRVTPSRLPGAGRIVRGVYTFKNAEMAEKEYFVRVDVTNEFPMIVTGWQPYLERGERS